VKKKKIFLVSEYPSLDKPTNYSWIKTRVEALKDTYEITVVRFIFDSCERTQIKKTELHGFTLCEILIKKGLIPKFRVFTSELKLRNLLFLLFESERPDVIHVHFSRNYSWVVKRVATMLGIPYFITEHATFFEESVNQFYYGKKIIRALNGANRVFAVSHYLKKTMEKYISNSQQIIVKYNIVDVEKFTKKERKIKDRNFIYMVSVGSLDLNDKKGYELLIKALFELKKENPTFRCDIIGEGPNKGYLQKLINDLNLEENVFLLGGISNDVLVDYYNEIDFFVSSSKIETFGVAIIEAMSCGSPVLSTKSGGPEEFINDSNGILVEKESWQSLYEGLVRMCIQYKNFDRDLIRNYIIDNFSETSYKNIMLKEYGDMK
jgi:Glycosyltransferase